MKRLQRAKRTLEKARHANLEPIEYDVFNGLGVVIATVYAIDEESAVATVRRAGKLLLCRRTYARKKLPPI
jgi:hypothetical protein